jgi:hypothetical protein
MRDDIRDYIRLGQLPPIGTLLREEWTYSGEKRIFLLIRYDLHGYWANDFICPLNCITAAVLSSQGVVCSLHTDNLPRFEILAKPSLIPWYPAREKKC